MGTLTSERNKTLTINSAALTDRGRRRKLNEDTVFRQTDQTRTGENIGLYMVCDGLGGHQAGEVASRLAVETVTGELDKVISLLKLMAEGDYTRPSGATLAPYIEAALEQANARLRRYGQSHPHRATNLGTTITLALIHNGSAHIANVGDSRAYIWRSGQLTQITEDHSLVAELVRRGALDEHEMRDHPHCNILSRALGIEDRVSADLFEWELQPGDRLLLCSDGLWQAFPDPDELAHWFGLAVKPAHLCQRLVEEANWRDGSDNISAVVVNVDGTPGWKVQNNGAEIAPNPYTATLAV